MGRSGLTFSIGWLRHAAARRSRGRSFIHILGFARDYAKVEPVFEGSEDEVVNLHSGLGSDDTPEPGLSALNSQCAGSRR